MTDNEKKRIAEWAGLNPTTRKLSNGSVCYTVDNSNQLIPTYSTDAEAIELLNVLVGKGYEYLLDGGNKRGTELSIFKRHKTYLKCCVEGIYKPTIHEAIVAAVLQVIEKEGGE